MQCNYRKCKRDAVDGRRVCGHHYEINKRKSAKQAAKYKAAGCRYCPQPNLPGLKVCERHRCQNREKCQKYSGKLRQEVLEHYGKLCVCCKESQIEFLTIDHINDDGAEHRRTEKVGTGGNFYSWLKRNKFPDGFQVLCWNCNAAKAIYGRCPHTAVVPGEI